MGTVRRVAKNLGVLLGADSIAKMLGFFFIIYTARYLGVKDFGVLSFAVAFTAIFAIFANLGLNRLMVREIARDKSITRKYFANATGIKIILALFTFALIALTVNSLNYPQETIRVVYLVALSVIVTAFSKTFNSVFTAFEKMEYVSLGNIIRNLLLLLGALFAIRRNLGITAFAFLYLLASLFVFTYSFVTSIVKFIIPRVEIDWHFWKAALREAWPFGLTIIFVTIYFQIDSVMLSLMRGDKAVGFYNAAYKIIFVIFSVRIALHTSIFPVMSRFYQSSKKTLKPICEKMFKYSILFIFPVAMGTTILARRFILLIYGMEYLPSVIALQILVWALVMLFANFTPRLFEATNKQIIFTKIAAGGVVINILLNLLLIPKFSYPGAAVATCLTELMVLILGLGIVSKIGYGLQLIPTIRTVLKVVMATVIMGIFIRYFYFLNLPLLIILSALIYALLLLGMRIFDSTDISIFRSLFKRETK